MQYKLHDYIEKVTAEIQKLGQERNTSNERVKVALEKSTGKIEECDAFTGVVQKAIEADKMYAYYSARMGDLRRQAEELRQAEQARDAMFARYIEKVRLHMSQYGGMQANPDILNYQGLLQQAIQKANALSMIEVEDRYVL